MEKLSESASDFNANINPLYQKNYLTTKNRVSFAVSGFGQNLIYGLVSSYILFFYTNVFLLGAGPTAALMISARIWDAFNDPIMGTFVDRTRTKWGKMRPYLLFVTIPLIISTALLFFVPRGLPQSVKIAYAYITYIMWGMVYTVCDVPFWGLASAMTPNPDERIKFISQSRLVHSIGSALPFVLVPLFVGLIGNEWGYTVVGAIAAVVGGCLFSLSFFGSKERTYSKEKAPSLKGLLSCLKINKPLRCIVLTNALGCLRGLPLVAGMYVATYILKSATLTVFGKVIPLTGTTLNTFIIVGWAVSGFIGMMATPFICKKFNYKHIVYISAVIGVIISIVLYFIGPSLINIIVCLIVVGFPFGIISNINYAMIADSVEYVEWKTGKRTEGITVSFQTFMNKLTGALQVGIVALSLIVIKFVAPIEGADGKLVTQPQSEFTLKGFFFLISILPALGWVLSIIPMFFYTFIGKERETALRDILNARKVKEKAESDEAEEISAA